MVDDRDHYRVYIAGPMSGHPDYNHPAFHEAAELLRGWGNEVVSPAELDGNVPPPNGDGEWQVTQGEWQDFLRRDLAYMLGCDAVVTLPGWYESRGASLEVSTARTVGISVVHLREGDLHAWPLIGLTGYAQVGKDTVAGMLAEYGFTRVAFADPLKALALDIGWSGRKDKVGRELLQDLGVGVRERIGDNTWVDLGMRNVDRVDGAAVVTDVRFDNEAEAILARGGYIIRITRPGVGPANEHVSEHAISDEYVRTELPNDGSLDALRRKVDFIAEAVKV